MGTDSLRGESIEWHIHLDVTTSKKSVMEGELIRNQYTGTSGQLQKPSGSVACDWQGIYIDTNHHQHTLQSCGNRSVVLLQEVDQLQL